MSLIKSYLHANMNDPQMLTAREQLMEDIDCIVDDYFQEYGITNDPELVKVLCDAVCKNFPLPETNVSELEATANNYTTGK